MPRRPQAFVEIAVAAAVLILVAVLVSRSNSTPASDVGLPATGVATDVTDAGTPLPSSDLGDAGLGAGLNSDLGPGLGATPTAIAFRHIWPFSTSSTAFGNPQDAARSFAVDYLGMTNARIGMTSPGSPGLGLDGADVEMFTNAGTARTVVNVVQDGTSGWVVMGAKADQIVVDQPLPHDPVSAPMTVSGRSTAFEGQLGLQLRPLDARSVVESDVAIGGSNGEMAPFLAVLQPAELTQPLVLVVFAGDASGAQTFSDASVVLLGA